mgnify:CR=1 FL=1
MIFAFYGRIRSGKDTAAQLLFHLIWRINQEFTDNPSLSRAQKVLKGDDGMTELRKVVGHMTDITLESELAHYVTSFPNEFDKQVRVRNRIAQTSRFLKFSAAIKKIAMVLTACDSWELESPKLKETFIPRGFTKTLREIMIGIGQGLRLSVSPDVWIAAFTAELESVSPDANNRGLIRDLIFVTDLRHANEYDFLNNREAYIFRVTSDFQIFKTIEEAEGILDDFEFDYTLENKKGNLTHLFRQMADIVIDIAQRNEKFRDKLMFNFTT